METTNHKSIIDTYTQKQRNETERKRAKAGGKTQIHAARRDSLQISQHTQTESKETGKVVPCK